MTKAFLLVTITILLGTLGACGSDASCEQLCEEAQAGDCTDVAGNCGSFCGALDDVESASGCADERDAYESCLNSKDAVCDVDCDAKENALESCVIAYCAGNAGDPSCVTLAGSF